MTRYAVVLEKGETSYGAYVPDLPGCVAVGKSEAEVRQLIAEAIDLHVGGAADNKSLNYFTAEHAEHAENGRRKGENV